MRELEKAVFLLAHSALDLGFHRLYTVLMRNQWKRREDILKQQSLDLRRIVRFCFERVPFYKRHLNGANIKPADIHTITDLEKIPSINKADILANPKAFIPTGMKSNYHPAYTAGTTGMPMHFRISHNDYVLGVALSYRSWSAGGYALGNRMAVLAGSALMPDSRYAILVKANEIARNVRFLSAYHMDDASLVSYLDQLLSWNPSFLRGYPSAIYEFAKFLERENLELPQLKAIITTSEKLLPHVRMKVEEVFGTRVFDEYGANDGGISAVECDHQRMHVNTERSIMEIVGEDQRQIDVGTGKVLATSLKNYAMPFLRYELGDEAVATDEKCPCGRGLPVIEEILGRTVSSFITPDGVLIHGWFFGWLMIDFGEAVRQYKITQVSRTKIEVLIVPGNGFDERMIQKIRALAFAKCKDWKLDINIVDEIPISKSGKRIFIESRLKPE
ncbi:MAG: phenylacetate--CoA ligase family protein [Candidatus Thorarchaeota archaeon]|jgi:phenylacetate-CoA ligase